MTTIKKDAIITKKYCNHRINVVTSRNCPYITLMPIFWVSRSIDNCTKFNELIKRQNGRPVRTKKCRDSGFIIYEEWKE